MRQTPWLQIGLALQLTRVPPCDRGLGHSADDPALIRLCARRRIRLRHQSVPYFVLIASPTAESRGNSASSKSSQSGASILIWNRLMGLMMQEE